VLVMKNTGAQIVLVHNVQKDPMEKSVLDKENVVVMENVLVMLFIEEMPVNVLNVVVLQDHVNFMVFVVVMENVHVILDGLILFLKNHSVDVQLIVQPIVLVMVFVNVDHVNVNQNINLFLIVLVKIVINLHVLIIKNVDVMELVNVNLVSMETIVTLNLLVLKS